MKTSLKAVAILGFISAGISSASAASAILKSASGLQTLGVDHFGQSNSPDSYGEIINSSRAGIAFQFAGDAAGTYRDATSPGCFCEGWGVSASGHAGYANNSAGTANLTQVSFTSDDTGAASARSFATVVTDVTSLPGLRVTQAYTRAVETGNAFQDLVTITNTTGGALTDVRYVRVMDWDVPKSEFREYVTIIGTATTTELELSHNNGFSTANPLGSSSGSFTNVDFTDAGPYDHGAYFKFNFGTLANGESRTFKIFYGANSDEASALADLAALAPELYSLGQSSTSSPTNSVNPTFYFAFKGVGGSVVTPPVPDGGQTLALLGIGLMGLGGIARRMRRKA